MWRMYANLYSTYPIQHHNMQGDRCLYLSSLSIMLETLWNLSKTTKSSKNNEDMLCCRYQQKKVQSILQIHHIYCCLFLHVHPSLQYYTGSCPNHFHFVVDLFLDYATDPWLPCTPIGLYHTLPPQVDTSANTSCVTLQIVSINLLHSYSKMHNSLSKYFAFFPYCHHSSLDKSFIIVTNSCPLPRTLWLSIPWVGLFHLLSLLLIWIIWLKFWISPKNFACLICIIFSLDIFALDHMPQETSSFLHCILIILYAKYLPMLRAKLLCMMPWT